MFRLTTCWLIALLAYSHSVNSLHGQPDRTRLIAEAEKAVVVVHTYGVGGTEIGTGSGVIIPGGRVLTNLHVLEGATRVEVFDGQERLLGTATYAEQISTRADVAVLPSLPNAFNSLSFAREEPAVGTDIIVIGSPLGLTNTASTGIISGYRTDASGRFMQITAPISPGSSGGPVLNLAGEIVGLSMAQLPNGQNLNFAVPLFELRAVAASQADRLPFPQAQLAAANAPPEPSAALTSAPSSIEPVNPGQLLDATLGSGRNGATFEDGTSYAVFGFPGRRGQYVNFYAKAAGFPIRVGVFTRSNTGEFSLVQLGEAVGADGGIVSATIPTDGSYQVVIAGATPEAKGNVKVAMTTDPSDQAATQGRWTVIGLTADNLFYVDRSSVVERGVRRKEVWARMLYFQKQVAPVYGQYDESMLHLDYDCEGNRYRARQVVYSDAGKVIYNGPAIGAWTDWQSMAPGSLVLSSAPIVCR